MGNCVLLCDVGEYEGLNERQLILIPMIIFHYVFTWHELKQVIKISHDTSPGIDTVHYHYQLLKHLPDDSLLLLLYIMYI